MPEQYHLRLPLADFDLSLLPAPQQRGSANQRRKAIATYIRRQFTELGGTLHAVSVDQLAIEATWSPDGQAADFLAPLITWLEQGKYPEAILLMRLLVSAMPDNPVLLYNQGMALSDKRPVG